MPDKLSIYNGALRLLGERKLSSLTEDRPARYYLDDAWDDGLIQDCLEEGYWNFATRTIMATAETGIEPEFGYRHAFQKPTDYVKLKAISVDEYFRNTLHDYSDETNYWYCDYDVLYIQYISNDVDYGNNIGKWTQSFEKFVKATLADEVKELVTGNDGKYERVKQALKDAKTNARSKDAMNRPTKFGQTGSWVSARMNGSVNKDWDRNSRG